jgi:membrane protein
VANLGNSNAWKRPMLPGLLSMLGLLQVFLRAHKQGDVVDLGRVNNAGWIMHEELWLEQTGWLETEQIIIRAQAGGYVLSRDLDQMQLVDLLGRLPDRLPNTSELPSRLQPDAPWYPPLLAALARLEEQRRDTLGGSVKEWLNTAGTADGAATQAAEKEALQT